jgi:hypothetical protein
MQRLGSMLGRLALAAALLLTVAGAAAGSAKADGSAQAGWYGPYSDGCDYYWNGDQWTGDVSCAASSDAGSGYAAGWYGPYGDGCDYYWDGAAWTGQADCPAAASPAYAAGWYGPFDDGCSYYWDGTEYTGDKQCAAGATAAGAVVAPMAPSVGTADGGVVVPALGGCGDFCTSSASGVLIGQLDQHPVDDATLGGMIRSGDASPNASECAEIRENICYQNP